MSYSHLIEARTSNQPSAPGSRSGPRPSDIELARNWASFYRLRGFNPLPSRMDAKRPFVRFAQWWSEPAPDDLFDRHPTTNVQLMTGRRWRLLVIDLDGPEAREWFQHNHPPVPRTWVTHSGGDGQHLWFRLPDRFPRELAKAVLWKGEGKHAAVERLCDRSLIMVPPSIHPGTGKRYRFLDRNHSPVRLGLPALCPAWILGLRPIEKERPVYTPPPRPARLVTSGPSGRFRAQDVVDAIPDKLDLAASWGLRIVSRRPNSAGWCSCHAVGREDRNPSASISVETGRYWEPGEHSIGLFDLAVRLGIYADWRDAVDDLGRRFGAKE